MLAKKVFRELKTELQSASFFATIFDITQNVSKKDQLREEFR